MISGAFALLFGLLGLAFVVACFVFWIWMLIDYVRNERIDGNQKIAWVLVIALLHGLGALIYFLAGRNRHGQLVARI
jgi:hypothetical protein